MILEVGHFALILALLAAAFTGVAPLVGAQLGYASWMRLARPMAWVLLALTGTSFACLCAAFIADDFSSRLVAAHSSQALPMIYKFCATWGNHEGSLLLWATMLCAWMAALSAFGGKLPREVLARALSVMALLGCGFLSFALFTSNPFLRNLPFAPTDGQDLNPLLQDPAMAMHPPMLYAGYVGFSVAFAFAIAALLGRGAHSHWAGWVRPWCNAAWALLTVGIALGSWWAYYELGWGGWWFWDPVENASFMPWLVGTALIHSLAVTERRGTFYNWSLLLAIFTFALSLLGAFLVRSGVLVSVHAFAADPTRGVFVLSFLTVVIGGALLLFAWRAPFSSVRPRFSLRTREGLLLFNNLGMVVAALAVLTGTLFPLVADALGLGKYSVGPPYFNALFVPLMCGLMALMLILPAVPWGGSRRTSLRGVFSRPRWGMTLAHTGLFCCALGVAAVTLFERERDVGLAPGERAELGSYSFVHAGARESAGPNYQSQELSIEVLRKGQKVATLAPEKRTYERSGQSMTEAAIDAGLWRDIYVSLGEPLDEEEAWGVRLRYKPMVRLIWLGALVMACGAALGLALRLRLLGRRRRT